MKYQVWISKETEFTATSHELGFFTPEQCKENYLEWVADATAKGFEQLVINPIGLDRKSSKKIVIKL